MKTFVIFEKSTGQISSYMSCPEPDIQLQLRNTQDYLEVEQFPVGDHYVDIDSKQVVEGFKDFRPVEVLKMVKWIDIKQARAGLEFAPITVGEHTFDADASSQQKIMGAVQLASLMPDTWVIEWTLSDNSTVTLTKAELIAVGVALGTRTSAIYAESRVIRAAIEACATSDDLAALNTGTTFGAING